MKGAILEEVPHSEAFWFAWAGFHSHGVIARE
jgi:hypothetical protein